MKGKQLSLLVKLYAVLFGSICYIVQFILNKELPNSTMVQGIVFMMVAFQSIVLSVDTSMVIKNIKLSKKDIESVKLEDSNEQ